MDIIKKTTKDTFLLNSRLLALLLVSITAMASPWVRLSNRDSSLTPANQMVEVASLSPSAEVKDTDKRVKTNLQSSRELGFIARHKSKGIWVATAVAGAIALFLLKKSLLDPKNLDPKKDKRESTTVKWEALSDEGMELLKMDSHEQQDSLDSDDEENEEITKAPPVTHAFDGDDGVIAKQPTITSPATHAFDRGDNVEECIEYSKQDTIGRKAYTIYHYTSGRQDGMTKRVGKENSILAIFEGREDKMTERRKEMNFQQSGQCKETYRYSADRPDFLIQAIALKNASDDKILASVKFFIASKTDNNKVMELSELNEGRESLTTFYCRTQTTFIKKNPDESKEAVTKEELNLILSAQFSTNLPEKCLEGMPQAPSKPPVTGFSFPEMLKHLITGPPEFSI